MFTLYHYTNFAGLYGMLKDFDSEKHPYLTMWATNASFLNDNSEYTFGQKVCWDAFGLYEAMNNIPDEKCIVNGYGYKGVIQKDKLNNTPCIVSFSATKNNASMWEMYSMNGNGVAIIFDGEKLENVEKRVSFSPCIYCSNEHDLMEYDELMKNTYEHYAHKMSFTGSEKNNPSIDIERIGRSLALLISMSPRIKHSSYEYENEFRLIRRGTDCPKFRIRKDIIIPYKEIFIPIDAVKGFIIGPTADFDYIYSSLEIFLASKGLSELDSCIVKSEVPYRG